MGIGKTYFEFFDLTDNYDPRIIATNSNKGTLFRYVPPVGLPVLLLKADDGFTTNWIPLNGGGGGPAWLLSGNALTGAAPDMPNEFMGSNNDYDVSFKRNTLEKMRVNADGLLVGLNITTGEAATIQALAQPSIGVIKKVLSPGAGQRVINVDRMSHDTTLGATTVINSQVIPNNFNGLVEYRITVKQTAGGVGVVGEGAYFVRTLGVVNTGGIVTIQFLQTDLTYRIDNGINVTFAAAGANVDASFSGVANRDLQWGSIINLHLLEG